MSKADDIKKGLDAIDANVAEGFADLVATVDKLAQAVKDGAAQDEILDHVSKLQVKTRALADVVAPEPPPPPAV